MTSWRDAILYDFVPHVSKLTLVADPDTLLTEEKLAQALRERGFDLIEFNDAVEFRYAYESNYRSLWDKGEHTDLVVILRLEDSQLESLPYDLLQAGRKLSFNLGDLFPHLSYPVIEKLDRSLLDPLFVAQQKTQQEPLGDNATKDFVLRHVFGIAAEIISSEVSLLRSLLQLHYSKTRIPAPLSDRLVQLLRTHGGFDSWPLEEIIPDEEAFFAFLQERWPIFLHHTGKRDRVIEDSLLKDLKFPGPGRLPFDHQDIKVYIDNLFLEGRLTPVKVDGIEPETGSWIRTGIATILPADADLRISRLLEKVAKDLPKAEDRYTDWLGFAAKWAELASLIYTEGNAVEQPEFQKLGKQVRWAFEEWLRIHYASLINLPPTNPAMLHHVPRKMARHFEQRHGSRLALIVVDGLALDQWITIRQLLQHDDRSLLIRESAVFAWIPTITPVSRQAVYSGRAPIYFPTSIGTTNNEEKLWRQFWEEQGVSRHDVAYKRGLGDGDPHEALDAILNPGKTRVLGLVVDKVDKIMHGMQLGTAGMHNQIRQWCKSGYLLMLIRYLLDHEFEIWLTSDHGNIEAKGRGRPAEGVIADTRGERVRVYPAPELRAEVAKHFTFAHEWEPVGLPPGYYPLVAGARDAFVTEGDTTVAHGGIAIEEVIVPLVRIERRTR